MGHVPSSAPDRRSRLADELWMLLTAISAVEDEGECARLAATGIPAVVRCTLSGVAFNPDLAVTHESMIQRGGQVLSSVEPTGPLDRLVRTALSSGELMTIRSGESSCEADATELLRRLNLRQLTLIPVITMRQQLGAILVGTDEAADLASEDESVLRILAWQLAVACENLQLHNELQLHIGDLEGLVAARTSQLRRSEERLAALLRINNALISILDRPSLFEAVARELRGIVEFDRASLAEFDSETDMMRVSALAHAANAPSHLEQGAQFRRDGSHLQSVIDTRTPRVRADLRVGARTAEEDRLLDNGLRSYLAVPLVVKQSAIGTLNVASLDADQYDQSDEEFLAEVAGQVALALDNVHAYEEIQLLKKRLEDENIYLREEVESNRRFEDIIGTSNGMRKVLASVEQVACTEASVLILGETGTGKELIARAIHSLSTRQSETMVAVNCAALPAGLIESELFGHEKGSFTGALARKIGRFEIADKSTLFLDEIGDLPLELQAKLLRVLQDGCFERVGGTETIRVDVRVIAATHRDLQHAVENEIFREDLFYRLNVFPIHVPPLRNRDSDIPLLVKHFALRFAAKMGKNIESIPKATMSALTAYSWPGNVRELQNVLERAVILCQGSHLVVGDWIPQRSSRPPDSDAITLDDVQRRHIRDVLQRTGWRVSGEHGAAKVLGLKPTTLEARMKKLGISRQS